MKVLLNVTLGELENKINRQIEVDENISLIDLCEFIIVSMNGTKIPIYELECGNVTYYPYPIEESKDEKSLENLKFKDLKLEKDKCITLEYDFDNLYYFDIVVDAIYEINSNDQFKILSGKGYGILEDKSLYDLEWLFKAREDCLKKSEREYLQKDFNFKKCNKKILEYIENKKNRILPKRYIFNVSLDGFKEIKRKIIVDNDITIDDFCRCVIVAMNGDLSHSYGIKIGKQYLSEYYNDIELFYLNLKEKQRLKVIYDLGDNWIFNLTLSKIVDVDDYGDVDFEVLSGKGYGIIDDCGGIWSLSDILSGKDTSWGKYDINDFDLEKCNEKVDKFC